jgi:hypothetical protein
MRNETLHTGFAVAAAAAALLLALPATADAQSREMYELPALQAVAFENPLHSRAMELYETPERWEEAGELHERAAKLLRKKDAEQFFGFQRASLLYFYAGKTARSRKAMERAADVAEATGDVLTAANTWVDAAFIAVAEGYAGKKRAFVKNARLLAASELLGDADRQAIIARIDGTPLTAAVARVAMENRLQSPLSLAHGD